MKKMPSKMPTKMHPKIQKGGRIPSTGLPENISAQSSQLLTYTVVFILFILFGMVAYMFYVYVVKESTFRHEFNAHPTIISTTTNLDKINDPYTPPLKFNSWLPSSWFYSQPAPHYVAGGSSADIGIMQMSATPTLQPIPVGIKTRGQNTVFQQVGYIKDGTNILPLMGRNLDNARDKSQYYTMTNEGNINTKLPVKVNGRNCSGEYGCDTVYDGDNIFVEGIDREYQAKIYENVPLAYI